MPRAFRSSAGGLVGHNGGVFAPNPNVSENALLIARSRRLNPEKVTPEITASYHTFAGITERGVAAVNFGPGVPEQAHQADEFVPIANLARAYEVLFEFVSAAPAVRAAREPA